MSTSTTHREIVKKLLESKAVDFNALGKVIADVGPGLAAAEGLEGDGFCGTNRSFIRVYRIFTPETPIENLSELAARTAELQG
jgi:hypothetical protein